mmetsp:Transcript_30603/g.56113  ORF Transcript_30603/g.56113 Transcript_30603/m.56113 type:complete len:209 (-) Transcript_30603:806-1432(-)
MKHWEHNISHIQKAYLPSFYRTAKNSLVGYKSKFASPTTASHTITSNAFYSYIHIKSFEYTLPPRHHRHPHSPLPRSSSSSSFFSYSIPSFWYRSSISISRTPSTSANSPHPQSTVRLPPPHNRMRSTRFAQSRLRMRPPPPLFEIPRRGMRRGEMQSRMQPRAIPPAIDPYSKSAAYSPPERNFRRRRHRHRGNGTNPNAIRRNSKN